MAHARSLSAVLLALVSACSPAPAPRPLPAAAPSASAFAEPSTGWEHGAWGRFHSLRHDVWLPLPDGRGWAIDDHKGEWLVATHAASTSVLRLRSLHEDHAQSHAKCEASARAKDPSLPREDQGRVIATTDDVLPGWDAHAVALIIPRQGAVEGHVTVFAANVRRCLVVHFATRSSARDAEAVVGVRLGDITDLVRKITPEDERSGPGREPPPR